ncbi:phosphoribosyltransferase [Thalassospira sp.]|uniref:phosphoribosyltransferase n=1 Tax=Thalassospira sp. TaxID=1912094 RepID=UPI0027333F34|nr:phosphoribosyltransferase [Thalassospira sp.]MDP2699913.1 phosphoribosyltransferase [Thalassospira sp.]
MAERAPWGDFPAVIRNGDLGELQQQPEYTQAKAGDPDAAKHMAERLVRTEMLDQIGQQIGNDRPRIVPVLAVEAAGYNMIPLAMAYVVGKKLGLEVDTSIYQMERVARTGEGADHRLAFNPAFDGPVEKGGKYLVFDDTLTMGGTLASLRGFLENRGGHVMAAAVMTAFPSALNIAVKPGMIEAINQKHGSAMDDFWKETFGYGIDQLTQGEAGHLRKSPSVDAIRTRIIEARHAVFSQAHARDRLAEESLRRPEPENRVTSEIPRPLQPYHLALKKLEGISAPDHEIIVAQRKLAIANDLYAKGELDVPGAHSGRIRDQAHEEARKIMSDPESQALLSPIRSDEKAEKKTTKKSREPGLEI